MENTDLSRLEAVLDKLLTAHARLKTENTALQSDLEKRKHECETLQKKLDTLLSDKEKAGKRVANLLDRIQGWEQEHEIAAAPRLRPDHEKQGSLLSPPVG